MRLVIDKKNGQTYAAKIRFNPAMERRFMNDKDMIINIYNRFVREVEVISNCNHENVVKFIRALRDDRGDLFIIMEHCDMGLMHMVTKIKEDKGSIEERQLVNILRQIAEGLNYLHEKNLFHRDIDPRNIMVKEGAIKIVDFGFSTILSRKSLLVSTAVGK